MNEAQTRLDKIASHGARHAEWNRGLVPVPLGNGNAVNQGLLREVFE